MHPHNVSAAFESLPSPREDQPAEGSMAQDWRAVRGDFASVELDGTEEPLDSVCNLGEGSPESARDDTSLATRRAARRAPDQTSVVADRLLISHPYLLVDVEPEVREAVADLRETMHQVCKEEWFRTAKGEGDQLLPLPVPERVAKEPHSYT